MEGVRPVLREEVHLLTERENRNDATRAENEKK